MRRIGRYRNAVSLPAACDDARRGRPTLWFSGVGDRARRPAQLVDDGLLGSRRAHRADATRLAQPNYCGASMTRELRFRSSRSIANACVVFLASRGRQDAPVDR
jgi:hypothetical protein